MFLDRRISFIQIEHILKFHQGNDEKTYANPFIQSDAQLTDFLEGEFLKEQVEAIKEISDLITRMKRAGDGLGLHIIDKELQS